MTTRKEKKVDRDYVEWQANVRLSRHGGGTDSEESPAAPAQSLEDLYARDGKAFIQLAYRTFLGRAPSVEELGRHLKQLNSGIAKSTVAARIRYSTEARKRPQQLSLAKAHWLDRLIKIPVLGRGVNFVVSSLSVPGIKRSLLSQQQDQKALRAELEHLKNYLQDVNRAIFRDIVTGEEQHKLDLAGLTRELHQEIKSLRDRQLELEQRLDSMSPASGAAPPESQGTPVDENFYIAFEDYFRGSEAIIRQRLAYYLPLINDTLPPSLKEAPVVDIGCGRGEWLGLLQEQGFKVIGVDLNEKNVESCRNKGLDANLGDGIGWLRQTASQSLSLVSSFHVIEHLTLAQMHSLLIESLRCLAPGGLLLLETPNPENLVTAAHRFYTDPSHHHPIPPDLLEFLLKYKGFENIDIHRLHPCEEDRQFDGDSELESRLNVLLYGPQDYAIFARKP